MGSEGHVYRMTEVVGSSPDGTDAAIRNAIAKASETIRNIGWFEVAGTRGYVDGDQVAYMQVTLKIGFRVD
ncbi:dodecin [Tomitella fengzijianii]|uniref:Dodecin domain-containing protein n=1 Tax=Tomitella fengzijianii TaxID=2597660 RepID=A0A516X040_9ACTN|nr:dodecin [Tomitella fengzijianii]QDQ96433.1 dodecin domain-containing protein [Tomitella fengzijianii]